MNNEVEQSKYWHRFWTVPNAFTLLRISSSVGLITFLASQGINPVGLGNWFLPSWAILTAATDFVDGTLARVLHQQSKWGQALDPIADKLQNWGIALTLMAQKVMPLWVLTIGARDLAVGAFTAKKKYEDGKRQEQEEHQNEDQDQEKTSFFTKIKQHYRTFMRGEATSPTYPAKMKMALQSAGAIATLAFGFGSASLLSLGTIALASIGTMMLPDLFPTTEKNKQICKLLGTAGVTILGSLLLGPSMIAPIMMSSAISMMVPEAVAIKNNNFTKPSPSTEPPKIQSPVLPEHEDLDQDSTKAKEKSASVTSRAEVDYTAVDEYIEKQMLKANETTTKVEERGYQYKRK